MAAIKQPQRRQSGGARPSRLGKVKKGRIKSGRRFTFYGAEAVGKTSLGASAPNPIFLDVEAGSFDQDVARYPFSDGDHGYVPESMVEVFDALSDLRDSEHDFETVVIDTVDAVEPLVWKHCCERDSGKQSALNKGGKKLISIESYGYGRGYTVALDVWRALGQRLDQLCTRRGMNVILLGHEVVRTFKNPEDEDYDRYQLRLHEKAAAFVKEWSDVVGYCQFEGSAAKQNEGDHRAKGYSTGRRLIRLERTAAFDAKSRLPLPDIIELRAENPWSDIQKALDEAAAQTPESLRKLINDELERIGGDDEYNSKVTTAVMKAGDDVGVLSRYLNKLRRNKPEEGTK